MGEQHLDAFAIAARLLEGLGLAKCASDVASLFMVLGVHCFTKYVKVAFFRGTSLRPLPPGESKSKDTRYVDLHEDDELDEAQLAAWVKQASLLPGERM